MTQKGLLILVFFSLLAGQASGDRDIRPVAPAWQMEELANWKLDYEFWLNDHRSTVPLKARQEPSGRRKLLAFHSQKTSNQYSQGLSNTDFSIFSSWSLVDIFVYWAGSASEGIIVPPPVYWTELAHKNGVTAYGVVNLQPRKFGGNTQNLIRLLEKNEDGSFPLADKLIEIAGAMGFDGWFINQETEGAFKPHALAMAEFIQYFQKTAPAGINLIWYDAMTEDGSIDHQGALSDANKLFFDSMSFPDKTGHMVIDYCWTENLLQISRLQKEDSKTNTELFFGVNAHKEKYETESYSALSRNDTNIALFASNWHYKNESTLRSSDMVAHQYWWGAKYEANWPGVCHYFKGYPSISRMPFITDFNTGQGASYFHEGKRLPVYGRHITRWFQPQQQTPMPDYCRSAEVQPDLTLEPNYNNAYQGGHSLIYIWKGQGELQRQLFSADYRIKGNEKLSVTYQHTETKGKVALSLTFSNDSKEMLMLEPCEEWCTRNDSLGTHRFEKLTSIALVLEAGNTEAIEVSLGQLKLYADAPLVSDYPEPRISDQSKGADDPQVRVSWNPVSGAEHYRLFVLDERAEPAAFIGQTHHTTWVLELAGRSQAVRVGIVPVSAEGLSGPMGIIDI